jgi:hypothetical protein
MDVKNRWQPKQQDNDVDDQDTNELLTEVVDDVRMGTATSRSDAQQKMEKLTQPGADH